MTNLSSAKNESKTKSKTKQSKYEIYFAIVFFTISIILMKISLNYLTFNIISLCGVILFYSSIFIIIKIIIKALKNQIKLFMKVYKIFIQFEAFRSEILKFGRQNKEKCDQLAEIWDSKLEDAIDETKIFLENNPVFKYSYDQSKSSKQELFAFLTNCKKYIAPMSYFEEKIRGKK